MGDHLLRLALMPRNLLVAQNDAPQGVRDGAQVVAVQLAHQFQLLVPRCCAWFHPLVELHAVLDPLVVEGLRGKINPLRLVGAVGV